MDNTQYNLLLADDDADDCMFFKEALEELPVASVLTTVNDGVELLHLLTTKSNILPDILFLDLNMPRKTGFECLTEIKLDEKLKQLPVIIFSTSFDHEIVNLLYDMGADYYIRKPGDFTKLKKTIHEAITITAQKKDIRPEKEKFVIEV